MSQARLLLKAKIEGRGRSRESGRQAIWEQAVRQLAAGNGQTGKLVIGQSGNREQAIGQTGSRHTVSDFSSRIQIRVPVRILDSGRRAVGQAGSLAAGRLTLREQATGRLAAGKLAASKQAAGNQATGSRQAGNRQSGCQADGQRQQADWQAGSRQNSFESQFSVSYSGSDL